MAGYGSYPEIRRLFSLDCPTTNAFRGNYGRRSPVDDNESDDRAMQREVDYLRLVKERTSVPVPTVFAWIRNSSRESRIRALVMLMECIPGNVGMDLNFDTIPSGYKSSFYGEMARI